MTNSEEKEIMREEKEIPAEARKEGRSVAKLLRSARFLAVSGLVVAIGAGAGFYFWSRAQSRVYIEKSQVTAAKIDLASTVGGRLEEVGVKEGDMILANAVVARVGTDLVKSKTDGIVVMARTDLGKLVAPGEAVVSIVNTADLRVVGQLQEDKGLSKVSVGERAVFTADAFGGRKYEGIVDEVSPTSRAGDVVFSISDKREKSFFNVKVRFDPAAYPELKNGMSAKLWIYRD